MTTDVTPLVHSDYELVDEVDCTYCDTAIIPAVEDFDTALECCCGNWHHYDCATSCVEYVDDLAASAAEDRASDDRCMS